MLDGLRYASEMAHISYARLSAALQVISASDKEAGVHELAATLLDAWSIIDSANRFRDLLANLPGLKSESWVRLLADRTSAVANLRDCVQHCNREVDNLAQSGGQLWGSISWMHVDGSKPTGRWFMLSGGTHFKGDTWLFVGPIKLPFRVPPDRVRLNAFGEQVYLWRIVESIVAASRTLEARLAEGRVRLVGEPTDDRRGADAVFEGAMEVVMSNTSGSEDGTLEPS